MAERSHQTSFSELASALAKDYECIYVIDPIDDSYVEYVAQGEELTIRSQGENFYDDTKINTRELVYPDDQEVFLETFRKSRVVDALKNGGSFILIYRLVINGKPTYYSLRTIKGDDERIFIAVENIDKQRRKELEEEESKKIYSEIVKSIGSLFEVIYHIDFDTGHYTEYSLSQSFSDVGIENVDDGDFFENVKTDIGIHIHEEDRDMLIETLDRDNLRKQFETSNSVSVNYRQIFDDKTYYFNIVAFKQPNDPNHMVLGVRNIDEQMRREEYYETYSKIAGALASRYEAIYYIDVETNEYTMYSASERYAKLGTSKTGKDFFEDAVIDIKNYIHKDDMERVLKVMNKKHLLNILAQEGSMTMSYRQRLGDKAQYVTMLVVRPKNDENHLVMGVTNIDAQVKREQLIKDESQTFSEIAMALAQRYEVIYQVNTKTNDYFEYTSSEKYARLKIGARGTDFFRETQKNMKRNIFSEDYPMMALAMQKETLLNNLQENGKFIINYRLILDNRPQYVTLLAVRVNDESDNIIIAVSNIDSARKKELEFEDALGSALEMANNDALTGLKNKRYYAQKEMLLDSMIEEHKGLSFAIVVCDINGLKQVNDNQGHKAGDAYIQDAGSVLRSVFKNSFIYRIGGDEFVVILENEDYKNRDVLMSMLHEVIESNREKGKVTMACGISDYRPKLDNRVQDVFERADRMMYLNKEGGRDSDSKKFIDPAKQLEMEEEMKFHEFFEELVDAMTQIDVQDVLKIETVLIKICSMYRLSKAVTRLYRNPQEEMADGGETLCCYDTGIDGEEIISIRIVTKVMTIATMKAYMSPNEKPLTDKERERVELCMRTTLTYVSRNRLRDMVEELTYFDEVGYANLKAYQRYIMSHVRDLGGMAAIKYNLRHFALVNRELGKNTGDVIMKKHFETMTSIVGKDGIVCRLGGDNFVALCSQAKLGNVLTALTEMQVVYDVSNERSVNIATTAGVYRIPEDNMINNPGEIMEKIIVASSTAQTGGKDRIVFYQSSLLSDRDNAMKVQQMFPAALRNEEFCVYYQPKVDIRTGEIIGAEALCRWFHDGKMISPGQFIPMLEETSDICKLDFYMLDHVCRDIRRWLNAGKKVVRISVNMSRKHMMNTNFLTELLKTIDRHNVPHSCIEIELTETTIDVEFDDLKKFVSGLQKVGILASVDDFGVGFSSLNLIREIRWDVIKVDRSFLPIEGDSLGRVSAVMFKHVIAMTNEMGIECIVEGVETEQQLNILRENNCFHAQGFLFDRPIPTPEFEEKLAIGFYEV